MGDIGLVINIMIEVAGEIIMRTKIAYLPCWAMTSVKETGKKNKGLKIISVI